MCDTSWKKGINDKLGTKLKIPECLFEIFYFNNLFVYNFN